MSQRCERLFCKDICWLTRASGCREMCTAGREHAAAIWRPCDCARALLGHAGRIGVHAHRFESGRGQWRRGRLRPLPQRVPGAHCVLNAQDDAATGRCVRGAPRRRPPCRKVEQSMRAAGAYSAAQRRLMVWSTWPFTVLGTCKRRQIRGVHSGSRWYIDGGLTPVSLAPPQRARAYTTGRSTSGSGPSSPY